VSTAAPRSNVPPAVLTAAIAAAAGISAVQIAGLSARDGLFLSQLPASQLPAVMVAAGVVSLLATFGLSQWMRGSRPDRVAPIALLAMGASFAGIGALIDPAPRVAAVLLYLQVTSLGPVIVSSFWSVANERFDPYEAKKVVARMAAAGALGGVAGGALAERLTTWSGVPVLLFTLAGISCACAWAAHRVGSRPSAHAQADDAGPMGSGFALLRRVGLLRRMATLMLLLAAVETVVEYAFKVEAAESFQSDEDLVRFFAIFYAACGVLAFAIQSVVGHRFLRRFGLAGAVAILPASVALLGAPAVLVAKLWTVTLARGAETVASGAFFRAGFQLLYTPMATGVKRPAKVWVDVASGSLGEILGAALVFGLLFAIPGLPTEIVMAVAVAGSLTALFVVRRVRKGYVGELTDSLRRGRVEIRAEDVLDRTTLQTIADSQISEGRRSLLERVRAYDAEQAGSTATPPAPATTTDGDPASRSLGGDDPFPAWTSVLESDDVDAIQAALRGAIDASPERRLQLVAWVLPLLADDRVARAARDYLRPLAPRAVGQLVDALLAPERPLALRTRVAWVLGGLDDPRAAEGLWRAASNERFPVRATSVRALARIVARNPEARPSLDEIQRAVLRELEADTAEWSHQRAPGDEAMGERSVLLGREALRGVQGTLEHVFTLLAIGHERALIASALAGLTSGDDVLRGTALELLESVLPAPLRRALWPRIQATARATEHSRPQAQIADELLDSTASQVVDLEAFRRSS
jgi:hypothetical protein